MSFDVQQHSLNSTLRETILEHGFVASMLTECWKRGLTDVEILRSEFDGYGYDLVMSHGSLVRHVQLKSGLSKPSARISVQESLFERQSACIVFLYINHDLELLTYFYLGGLKTDPLPRNFAPEEARGTRYNSQGTRPKRAGHFYIDKSKFEPIKTAPELLDRLLGQ